MINKDNQKLLQEFANQSDRLFKLGIIRTDSFTGEIGEYIASEHFNFRKTERVAKAIDGVDKKGKSYQVKAKVVEGDKVNYGIGNLDVSKFNFLVIVYFDRYYSVKQIIKIDSNQLPKGKVNISNGFLHSIIYEKIESNEISIPNNCTKEINRFGELYNLLVDNEIIRSRRIVGDLGEYYACHYLNLNICDNKNEVGVDAIDSKGNKYEVKTRRVYESGRRKGKSRRLNNLVGKGSKFLVVVVLDRSFWCAGMWLIPMKNVLNPKSAHLRIVNTTLGVKNIVPSKIDWLH